MRELATTDPLTGLANYRRLLEVLRAEIARVEPHRSRPFAVVFVDMDGLKRINDKFGHLAGSRALCRVGRRAARVVPRRSTRRRDTAATSSPSSCPRPTEAGGTRRARRASSARLQRRSGEPPLSVSGGVAVFPRDGDSPTLLLRAADRVLYAAKAQRMAASRAEGTPTNLESARSG